MLLSAALFPIVACIFTLASGQNMCATAVSNLAEYQANVTAIFEILKNQIQRLEMKIDNLNAIVNKVEPLPMDCDDVRKKSQEATIESGLYLVQAPGLHKRRIFCNFTEHETWTTISRRINGDENFNRTWVEYKNGFGKANGDYWIGNDMLYQLTNANNYSLRITMKGFIGTKISSYKSFKLEDDASSYRLKLGEYDSVNSNGGDSFFPNASCNKNRDKDAPFSTYDYGIAKNCSKTLSGGWWFTDCGCSNLNGKYIPGGSVPTSGPNSGLYWETLYRDKWGLKSSLRNVIMEIKKLENLNGSQLLG